MLMNRGAVETGLLFKILFEAIMAIVFYRASRYWFNPEKYTSHAQRAQMKIFQRLFGIDQDTKLQPSKLTGYSTLALAGLCVLIILIDASLLIQSMW